MAERRPQVAPYYRALAALRRAHPAFTRGAVRWLRNGDEQRVLSYERAGAGESLVVVVNLSSQPYAGIVEAPAGEYRDITPVLPAATPVSPAQQDSQARGDAAGGVPRAVGIQGFPAGNAVNTYACDCQVCAAGNILGAGVLTNVWVIARAAARDATTLVRRGDE